MTTLAVTSMGMNLLSGANAATAVGSAADSRFVNGKEMWEKAVYVATVALQLIPTLGAVYSMMSSPISQAIGYSVTVLAGYMWIDSPDQWVSPSLVKVVNVAINALTVAVLLSEAVINAPLLGLNIVCLGVQGHEFYQFASSHLNAKSDSVGVDVTVTVKEGGSRSSTPVLGEQE